MGNSSANDCSGKCQSEESKEELKDSIRRPAANIILNHDFSAGLHLWHPNCCVGFVSSPVSGYPPGLSATFSGCFAVITNRKLCFQGLEQDITDRVSVGSTYKLCAWVGISGTSKDVDDVQATLKLEYQNLPVRYSCIGRIRASKDRWEKIEGAFCLSTMPRRVILYLEGPLPGMELLIRSVVVSSDCDKSTGSVCFDNDNGNIIQNPRFDDSLINWSGRCCKIALNNSMADGKILPQSGKYFVSTANRTQKWNAIQQEITGRVQMKLSYDVIATVRIFGNNISNADVRATLWIYTADQREQYIGIASVQATDKDWVQFHGKFILSGSPSRVIIYLEGPPPGTDILLDNLVVKRAAKAPPASPPIVEKSKEEMKDPIRRPANNIILNHDFSSGLHLWHPNWCVGFVVSSVSGYPPGLSATFSGCFAVIKNRKEYWQGLEQDITDRVSIGSTYKLCAWVGISGTSKGVDDVQATLKLEYQDLPVHYLCIGRTRASKGSWEKIEGSFCLSTMPRRVIFYVEGPSPGIELLIRSVVVSRDCNAQSTGSECDANDNNNIIQNPRFDDGLINWSERCCRIVLNDSMADGKILPQSGKYFASTASRTENWNGIQQEITGKVQIKLVYDVVATVRIFGNNISNADVRATLWIFREDKREQYIGIASVQATDKDWVQLHGKFILYGSPSRIIIYLEGPPPGTDILLDSLVVKHASKAPPASPPLIENAAFGVNIIANSNLSDGTNSWSPHGDCTLRVRNGSPRILPPMVEDSLGPREPLSGHYILVSNRSQTWMGPSQLISDKVKLYLTYQVSAWVRIGTAATRPQVVNVSLRVDGQCVNGGQVEISGDKWHELGGSFRIEKQSVKIMVYIHGPDAGVDLMVAGLQIFPVNRCARFEHLKNRTEKIRKRDVILKFTASNPNTLVGTLVNIRQTQNSFPFGSCVNRRNIDNKDFVDFFTKNFNWAVCGNELKWSWTEPQKGNINYKDADEILNFCKSHNIHLRGHCILWEMEAKVQPWVRALSINNLMPAVQSRLSSLLTRYKGKFKHYDVNNEMMHGSFYQDRLGKDIRVNMFKIANQLDPTATLFVNDYYQSSPDKYIQHILDLQEQGAPVGGIGIQGHVDSPVGPIVCSALNKLGIMGLPIWFTELDVSSDNEYMRAEDLEVMLREAFAHPAVDGVMLWGFWELFMSRENAHLVNAEGDINEAGKRYLALKNEWLSRFCGYLDDQDQYEFRGFHGSYEVEVFGVSEEKVTKTFVVYPGEDPLVLSINL